MKQAIALVLLGMGFAVGMVVTLSCASGHKGSHESGEHAVAQGQGEKAEKDGDEQKIPFADAPAAVRTAMLKLASEKDVKSVERATDEGRTTFEIEYTAGGEKRTTTMTDKGEMLELETPVKSLPDAVKAAIAKEMPGSTIGNGESVQLFYYEVVVTPKDGKKTEVKVFANGQFVGEEQD